MAVELGGPDVGDAAQEAVAVAPAPHAGQQRARDVLEREVEVGHAGAEHGLDQLVGQPRRIEIEQPGALDTGRHRPGQRDNGRRPRPARPRGPAPSGPARRRRGPGRPGRSRAAGARRRGVGQQRLDLGQDLVGGPGPLLAPERRDGAEAADAVAALGHLHVGPGGAGRRTGQLEEVEAVGRTGPRREARARAARATGTADRGATAVARSTPNPATRSTSGRASASSSP